jgi:N-acetylglucosamine-6-phosphate deacetylase
MRIEHAPDGSVREPGSPVLAGSALRLDQAVRNVVTWGFADAAQALAMASSRPAALLGLADGKSEVIWDDDLAPRTVTAGGLVVSNGNSRT